MRLGFLFDTEAATEAVAESTAAVTPTTTTGGFGSWPVIKQIALVFGFIMEGIFVVLAAMGVVSGMVPLCIIVFTIVTKMLLLPLTIKQQKFTKINALMTPEIQALQKKYEGKRDQISMTKMRSEQQAIYDKYGTSMSAGCLPSLIQLPLLFGLYPVIYNMPNYVPQMANYTAEEISRMYNLFGINLLEAPGWRITPAIVIPLLAGILSYLSTKMMQPKQAGDNPAGGSMKMMNYMMPFMSLFFCITLPAFLGFYWVIQSVVMIAQQFFINRHYDKIPVDELVKANIEKTNKKRAKKGLPPINQNATVNTKKLNTPVVKSAEEAAMDADRRAEGIRQSTDYYNKRAGSNSGSLAAKANMVRDYNERHNNK